jgi:DNA-binding LacI/PurR family transcriptional regulator/DNA-binding transcriptional regulator YhcF (GntR family)
MTSETEITKPQTERASFAYRRIEEDIRSKVQDGRLPPGTMLAGRHQLARQYGVALSTAQQAVANLIAEGVLESLDRRGTFVAQPRSVPARGEAATSADFAAKSLRSLPSWPPIRQGTLAPAAQAKDSTARLLTLGIVATSLIDQAASPDVGSLWARQAIRALEEAFGAAGGTTRFFDRYPDGRGGYTIGIDDPNAISMTDAILSLRADGVDGLAIVGLCDGRDVSDEIVAAVDIESVPVVYISWHEMRPPVAQVFYDSGFAGYQAAQHLLRRGYRRLVFLAPFVEAWLDERIAGARDAVRHAGLVAETLVVHRNVTAPSKYDLVHAQEWAYDAATAAFDAYGVFASDSEPFGVIAPNDFMAYAVLEAAAARGKAAGPDYGLIGFDDDPLACARGLTTVRPPIEAMGHEAGRLLLRALAGEKGGAQVRLRSQIIPRTSTARRPGSGRPDASARS